MPTTLSRIPQARLKPDEASFSHRGEPGIEVVLTSRDLDLIGPLGRREITIAWAKRLIKARRADEAEAREEAHQKHLEDLREAWGDEFGE
jgi:hypothetical protein